MGRGRASSLRRDKPSKSVILGAESRRHIASRSFRQSAGSLSHEHRLPTDVVSDAQVLHATWPGWSLRAEPFIKGGCRIRSSSRVCRQRTRQDLVRDNVYGLYTGGVGGCKGDSGSHLLLKGLTTCAHASCHGARITLLGTSPLRPHRDQRVLGSGPLLNFRFIQIRVMWPNLRYRR